MSTVVPGVTGFLGQRVQQARARAFVGRERELALINAALDGDGEASVFYLHGPGGIGKTTLLRHVAEDARRLGRPVVEVDGRSLSRTTSAFEAVARTATTQERPVLLVDTFDQCQWIETWLRDRFLPRLPADAVVVLAGRLPPDLEWSVDPGWSDVVCVIALEALDREHAAALLTASGLAPHQHHAVLRFAGGNPLVLSLAVAVAGAPDSEERSWAPSAQVLQTLVARLIGDVPSPVHHKALQVAAQAFTTHEDLLRAVLPEEDASSLFSWLASLPFVESVAGGLHPHDAAREALVADLKWRNSTGYDEVRDQLATRLVQRAREVPEAAALSVMGELAFVYRDLPRFAHAYAWERRGQVESERLQPDDLPWVLDVTRSTEGDDSAAIVRYWFQRQPEGFRLYRSIDTGEPVAFAVRLLITEPDAADLHTDPVVAAAWQHCQRTEPLAAGQHIAIRRFTIHGEVYQQPSPAMNLVSWQSLADICRSPDLAYAFVVYQDAEFWRTWLGSATDEVDEKPVVDGKSYLLFVNDWRYLTFERWLGEAVETDDPVHPAPIPAVPELSRDEFDEAVRQALSLWRQRGGLSGSRLGSTALVPTSSEDVDTALRAALRETLQSMRADARSLRGRDAVEATYLGVAATQQAAARRIGVPFSTYRRHLKQGIDELCHRLWQISHGR